MRTISCFLMLIILLFACQSSNTNNSAVHEEQYNSEQNYTTTPVKKQVFYINDLNNNSVADISISDQSFINFGDEHLYTKIGSSGKRKYIDTRDESCVAKINLKEGQIKLKTEQGNLLWKIKIYDDKIKIAQNEEMTNAFTLKFQNENYIKIKKNEDDIGKAIYSGSSWEIKNSKDGYLFICNKSISPGLMAIESIPLKMRLIMISELLLLQK